MGVKCKQFFSHLSLYGKMDLQWFLQDTKTCIIVILSELVSSVAAISSIVLLAVQFEGIGGMGLNEILFMLGFFTMANGIGYMFTGFNINNVSRIVGRGQIDHMVIQPVPLWMQMATMGFIPVSGNSGFIAGLGLTAFSLFQLQIPFSLSLVLLMMLYVVTSQALVIGMNYIFGSAAFYKPAAYEEVSALSNDLFQTLGKFPLSGMPSIVTGLLTTLFPVGLTAWFPAMILLQKVKAPAALLLPVIIALITVTLATYLFRKGMNHYVKNGCNRYRSMGFRN